MPVPGIGAQRIAGKFAASHLNDYAFVIANEADATRVADLLGIGVPYVSWEASTLWSLVPYATSAANGWLCLDGSNNPIPSVGFPTSYLTKVGDPGYQAAFVAALRKFLLDNGCRGAFIDNVLGDLHAYTSGGVYPPDYPNQAAWQAAMLSFVTEVGRQLKNEFYLVGNVYKYIPGDPNSDNGTIDAGWFQLVCPHLNGAMAEYWLQDRNNLTSLMSDSGATYNDHWPGWVTLADTCYAAGCDFYPLHRTDTQGDTNVQLWGRANFLLKWPGAGGAAIHKVTDGSDPWASCWTADVGRPRESMTAVGFGYRRYYTSGVALVNPDATNSQTFTLDGFYLDGRDGTVKSSVTLSAKSATVLTSFIPREIMERAFMPVADAVTAFGSSTSPAANTSIASLGNLAAGKYRIRVYIILSGTAETGANALNGRFYYGATNKCSIPTVSGSTVNEFDLGILTTDGATTVQFKNAALATTGAVYTVVLVAEQLV